MTGRKRTGKCSFTKAARVKFLFIKLEEGEGGHITWPEGIFWKPKRD